MGSSGGQIAVTGGRAVERALASLTAGLVIGVIEVVFAASFAALIFGGALAAHLPDGVGLNLGAAAILLAILAWTAGRRGVIGSVQDGPAVVIAVTAASAAAAVSRASDAPFLTVVAIMATTSVATGVVFTMLGISRLGNIARFVPYPVVGGFFAGTGWLLVKGGLGVATGSSPTLGTLDDFLTRDALARWLPAVAFAVILMVLTRVIHRPVVIPAAIGAGLVLFAAGILLTGSSVGAAEAGGWLLGPFPEAGLWQPWGVRALTGADWGAVLGQAGGIGTAVLVGVLGLLLNSTGIELLLGRDFDSNVELRSAGVANLVVGVAGGPPGFHALSLTSLAVRMQARSRTVGLVASAVALATLAFGSAAVSLIPRMLLAGLVIFMGLSFLVEWLVDARRTMPVREHAIVLVILAVIVGWGLLPGVALGLVLAVVLFAVSYSRTDIVRQTLTGAEFRSNVDRPPVDAEELRALGEQVHILRLQGFMFFGTASGLLEHIRSRIEDQDRPPVRFLVLDFRRVTGVDSSAVLAFRKVMQLAKVEGAELVFTALPDQVRRQLEQGGVRQAELPMSFEPDLDRGVQRCEDALLAGRPAAVSADPTRLWAELGGGGSDLEERIRPYLERVEVPEGHVLIRQGDPPEDVFILASGRLTIELNTERSGSMRLRTIAPGSVVGEVAHYAGTPRSASVVADEPSVVFRLSRASLERMKVEDLELASALHHWFARMLAQRLSETLRTVDALLD
jgi:SulP family sulfate permease